MKRWLSKQHGSRETKYLRRSIKRSRRDPKHQVFVLSGTTARDDANQWRLYADTGRGYAIELDASVPLNVVSLAHQEDAAGGRPFGKATEFVTVAPWHHVLYKKNDLDIAMSALASYTKSEIARIDEIDDDEEKEYGAEVLDQETSDELALIAHLLKTPGFKGEQEVRVVARFMWFGQHVGYRAGTYGIAGHVHLVNAGASDAYALRRVVPSPSTDDARERDFVHPLAITGVRLGPLLHKGNKEAVKAFLNANGLRSASVRQSKVSLR
ncbi:DUF2971 domain-containing protein [Antricoccus suffuscus]|uniref:DUF2971 domain-containing protein n=1 Tax=Antricoccus suffuscus TaxID=1629062 RepID=UPI0014764FEE|nr:DUF2971 domain-containing protein [Antricoccus suffuscus]